MKATNVMLICTLAILIALASMQGFSLLNLFVDPGGEYDISFYRSLLYTVYLIRFFILWLLGNFVVYIKNKIQEDLKKK